MARISESAVTAFNIIAQQRLAACGLTSTMLSFPVPKWQEALISHAKSRSPSDRPPSLTFGRTVSPIIPDRLYLSDYYSAGSPDILQNLGITHIVSVMEQIHFSLPEEMEKRIKRVHISIADQSDQRIVNHFEETTGFIKKAFEENEHNKVLVCSPHYLSTNEYAQGHE
jgi:atypical dual specificity phosphatase